MEQITINEHDEPVHSDGWNCFTLTALHFELGYSYWLGLRQRDCITRFDYGIAQFHLELLFTLACSDGLEVWLE